MRVIAPDVGGGFGGKNRLMPEDIAVAAHRDEGRPSGALDRGPPRASARLGPLRATTIYDLTISADRDGTLLGVEGDIYIDAGAYALWPTGAFRKRAWPRAISPGPIASAI